MFLFFTIILVAIGLSMDTFSLSLSYGLFNLKKNEILKISITVGLFHFIMPLLGNLLGDFILKILPVSEKIIIGIIFLLISFDLIISLFKNEEIKPINNNLDILIFSTTVSIDSFSTGIALDVFGVSNLLVVFIFMIFSFLFTFLGLSTGKILHDIIGKNAEYIGIIMLLSLSLFYLTC